MDSVAESTFLGRVRRSAALAVVLAASLSSGAAAQLSRPIEVAPELGSQVDLHLEDGSNVVGQIYGGPQVEMGPYLASDPTGATFSVYCVDFLHGIHVGDDWTANVSRIEAAELGATRMGATAEAELKYNKAVWLAQQYDTNRTKDNWIGIQDAIWAILTPSAGWGGLRTVPGVNTGWLGAVNTAFAGGVAPTGFSSADWRVLTDVVTPGVQEYIVQVPPTTVTPEPVSMALLGTGLAGLGALRRRRRKREDEV